VHVVHSWSQVLAVACCCQGRHHGVT
jgi:hypothetical protein